MQAQRAQVKVVVNINLLIIIFKVKAHQKHHYSGNSEFGLEMESCILKFSHSYYFLFRFYFLYNTVRSVKMFKKGITNLVQMHVTDRRRRGSLHKV